MQNIKSLSFGFSDAENYKRRENKEFLNHSFIKNNSLDKLCEPSTTFLVGDKGTGKTAYSVYMVNNAYQNNSASLRYIRETEYQKFITLKKEKQLDLSDYSSIWKVIIYLLLAEQVYEIEGGNGFFKRFTKFQALHEAIQEYYVHAFSPEIKYALQFIRESKLVAELLSKHAKATGEQKESIAFSESRFQTNLLYIQKNFESALSSIKLDKNHILFIDGIDIRPSSIPYEEYLECIKGLANAVWEINNDFFPSIRDSKGRMRAVLLIRPDIFASLGLQNQNTKIRDNSVLLNWSTTYRDHRHSDLFIMSDLLLKHQQHNKTFNQGECWDYYFPFDTPSLNVQFEKPSSFVNFLRYALYRPRDVVTMLSMIQERTMAKNNNQEVFSQDDFDDGIFKRNYSDYLLGEVKDQLSFYYSDSDYENFLKFFEFLNGKNTFSYQEYLTAFTAHSEFIESSSRELPKFMTSAEDFLQFLYDLNIICYQERLENGKKHIHWCFKDRTYSNLSPKVKLNETYEIFYGMSKALNTGSKFVRS
ncbi:P-loop ATPase, Sll1717 family [Shewanella oncorhynchi]|uniref:P-loop ATPase, Sll1717 family n=1 Tax=Shewanella oncorhynchi TaxID=2726434 RepID=UPI002E7BB1E1|nr:funZ protein [Shewanella oncorhynchi]WVI92727.1 funZ protein [Shewanella oncorhynchi]